MSPLVTPRAISGFPEFLPEEQILLNRMADSIRASYERAGFAPIETCAVERTEVLTSKGMVAKEIFGLTRLANSRRETQEQDAELALRFDLTVPMARFVAQNCGQLDFPFKRYQIQKVWRGESPQNGRFREFYQADIDIIGNGTLPLFADVEILSVVNDVLRGLDIGDYRMRINNRKVLTGFLASVGVSDPERAKEVIKTIDKKDKVGPQETEADVRAVLPAQQAEKVLAFLALANASAAEIFAGLKGIANDELQKGLEELSYVYENALALGVPAAQLVVDPSISRGLDYYTGTVYETFLVGDEKLGSVCSGGRFDNLASYFTDRKLPGVGVSIGLTRLASKLIESGRLKPFAKTPTKVLVTRLQEQYLDRYLALLRELRESGVPAEISLEKSKLGKQLEYADRKRIPFCLVAGETEFAQGTVQLKDMRTGEKSDVPLAELIRTVKSRLAR